MYAIQFNLILNKTIFLLQGLVCSSNSNVGHLAGRPDESLSSSISVHLFGSYRQGIFSFLNLKHFNTLYSLTENRCCLITKRNIYWFFMFLESFLFASDFLFFHFMFRFISIEIPPQFSCVYCMLSIVEVTRWFGSPRYAPYVVAWSWCCGSSTAYRHRTTTTYSFWKNTVEDFFSLFVCSYVLHPTVYQPGMNKGVRFRF